MKKMIKGDTVDKLPIFCVKKLKFLLKSKALHGIIKTLTLKHLKDYNNPFYK